MNAFYFLYIATVTVDRLQTVCSNPEPDPEQATDLCSGKYHEQDQTHAGGCSC